MNNKPCVRGRMEGKHDMEPPQIYGRSQKVGLRPLFVTAAGKSLPSLPFSTAAHPHTHSPSAESESEELGAFWPLCTLTQRVKRQKEEGRWRKEKPKTGSSKPGRKKSGSTGFILQASLCLATTELGINRSEPFTTCTHHTQHPCRPQTASSSQ